MAGGQQKGIAMVAAVVLLFGVLPTAVVIAKMIFPPQTRQKECTTGDCIAYNSLLMRFINTNIDPCENFSAFVCSAWRPDEEHIDFAKSTLGELLSRWFESVQETLEDVSPGIPIHERATAMFKTCMSEDRNADKARNVRYLKEFMAERQLFWPEKATFQVNPLDVLIDLAVNWDIPLWFQVSFQKTSGMQIRRIIITPGRYALFWTNHHQYVSDYPAYWYSFFAYFNVNNIIRPHVSVVNETGRIQRSIFQMLLGLTSRAVNTPFVFPLGEIGYYVTSTTWEEWAVPLNKYYRQKPEFDEYEFVHASDRSLLTTLNAMFKKHSREELVEHIAWWFIQIHAFLADRELLEYTFGNKKSAETFKPLVCAKEVEAAYGMLLASEYVNKNFPAEERRNIEQNLAALDHKILDTIRDSAWMNEDIRLLLLPKLQALVRVLWPPEKYLAGDGLSKMYGTFSLKEDSLIRTWIQAKGNITALRYRDSSLYDDARSVPVNYEQPYVSYDYILNRVKISLGALSIPLYYTEGTKAMFFAGLGFSYTMGVMKALDSGGIKVTKEGYISWLSDSSMAEYKERLSCLGENGTEDIFPEIPAVEVAFSALEDALTKDGRSTLKTMKGYTEEQVFFISLCFMTCKIPGATSPYSANCHKVVMNVPKFAAAFNCKQTSKMNPEKKCAFFN